MSKEELKPGELPTDIPDVEMHGPVELAMMVHVMVPKAGGEEGEMVGGKFTLYLEAGLFPTQAGVKEMLHDLIEEALEDGDLPEGARLMTKPEFWEHIVKRETKMEQVQFPKDHDPNFVDPTADKADAEAPAIITNPNLH